MSRASRRSDIESFCGVLTSFTLDFISVVAASEPPSSTSSRCNFNDIKRDTKFSQ